MNDTVNDSSFHRLFGVFISPGDTFRRIRERPTWVLALVVLLAATLAVGAAVHLRTDYLEVMEYSLEQSGRAGQMSTSDMERFADTQERLGLLFVGIGLPVVTILLLLLALAHWLALRLVGSELTFGQSWAVYLHGALPTAVGALLTVPVVLSGGDLPPAKVASRDLLTSNLAFLASDDAGVALRSLLAGIDFFALWSVALLIIGYRVVARVSPALAGGVVILLWLAGLGLRVFFVWLSSGGMA